MLYGLFIVLIPLFMGYLFKINQAKYLFYVGRISMFCLYFILFLMGGLLGQLDNLAITLPSIGYTALIMGLIIQLCNIGCFLAFELLVPFKLEIQSNTPPPSRLKLVAESMLLCSMILIGGSVGFFIKDNIVFSSEISIYPLVVMVFCVGVQLRNSGIPIRQVFMNKRGIQLSIILLMSALISGVIIAKVCGFSIMQGLTFVSGLGWYSLSSTLISSTWGAELGSIAFFNDLSREIYALFTVPLFMRHFPSMAIGLTGATALDVSLPLIQKTGGVKTIPIAISFGFIINLIIPLLLAFFISLTA